jgi:hypothetical protein
VAHDLSAACPTPLQTKAPNEACTLLDIESPIETLNYGVNARHLTPFVYLQERWLLYPHKAAWCIDVDGRLREDCWLVKEDQEARDDQLKREANGESA